MFSSVTLKTNYLYNIISYNDSDHSLKNKVWECISYITENEEKHHNKDRIYFKDVEIIFGVDEELHLWDCPKKLPRYLSFREIGLVTEFPEYML